MRARPSCWVVTPYTGIWSAICVSRSSETFRSIILGTGPTLPTHYMYILGRLSFVILRVSYTLHTFGCGALVTPETSHNSTLLRGVAIHGINYLRLESNTAYQVFARV